MDEHSGHRERLRLRFRREGLSGFAPHEVLELLLTYAIPRVDTNPLAHELIRRFGSLSRVLEAAPAELEQVPGIGPHASALLTMLVPLLRVYEQEKLLAKRRLSTYADLAAYCRTLYLGAGGEQFYLLCLDARMNLLSCRLIAQGTPSQVRADPRLIVQELMRWNAVGAVLSHNHPSGSCQPSLEDIDITQEIQRVLSGVGIRLYDHVIIAGAQDYSFFFHHLLDARPRDGLFSNTEETQLAADRPQRVLSPRQKKNTDADSGPYLKETPSDV